MSAMMPEFDPARPFVLLDDASRGGSARLFTGLRGEIIATTPADVRPALERLRGPGTYAGFIGFESGYALEPVLTPLARTGDDGLPLLWFGDFAGSAEVDAAALLGDGAARIGALAPAIAEADYAAMLDGAAALIAAGDIYQANLTFAARFGVAGHPLAIYRRLRAAAAAPYAALVHTGRAWLLSLSPELFFALDDGTLTARPMKGTAPRGSTRSDDDVAAAALAADPKNRAENLMIVDLLRNDLSRVAAPGSVAVPALFAVERYPTLLQMTSTITATTAAHPVDVLAALFPCGSITGAPKIRAMQVIADLEAGPRGVYTGSIGHISGDSAAFNVAIRTLVMKGDGSARIGLGAGIVADSVAADEWRECLAKGAFLHRRAPPDIIETMRCDGGTVALLDRHLARAAATADYLGYDFDPAAVRRAVIAAADGIIGRLRLLVSPRGAFAIQLSPFPPAPAEPVTVALVPLPVAPTDWRLRHKTTDRGFYDDARMASGVFEVVFTTRGGHLTEGSFTNVFVERDGVLLTPPLAEGLLGGILRAELIATGRAVEAPLTPADLAGVFLIGNSLRGLIAARLP
ncbi:aminodeoxychorismate synthase component I [Polymorphobacter megasporae]|uniref:aminodeoxychorismate synthase component I n=1 Tax=Glacieibacterium megasporae TaxID=2835787 RepID=UPI002103E9A0|nr:aminodeoxychorismate synthase component I [Polymorphobacter megasporae]